MGLKLFNTLSRSIQEFAPLDPAGKKAGMYCCGPTVYDFAHIGNWRTFVFADLVRRYLEFKNFQVTHVMNITDVEDKIIRRVRETNASLREFTGKFEAAFFEDLEKLNCLRPHQTPRATEHIPEIISLIEELLARGIAYKAADGSVYFSIEKYRGCGCNYGQLLKLNFDEMRAGERVKSDEYAEGIRRRLRALESPRAGGRRHFLAESVWRRPARLAHRMFRDEHENPWREF